MNTVLNILIFDNNIPGHHHHKKGMKGWLDMGAWTKKKGAFGWYADFPVGKGK